MSKPEPQLKVELPTKKRRKLQPMIERRVELFTWFDLSNGLGLPSEDETSEDLRRVLDGHEHLSAFMVGRVRTTVRRVEQTKHHGDPQEPPWTP